MGFGLLVTSPALVKQSEVVKRGEGVETSRIGDLKEAEVAPPTLRFSIDASRGELEFRD